MTIKWKELIGFLFLVFIAGAGWMFIPSQSAFISLWFSIGYRFLLAGTILLVVAGLMNKPLIDRKVFPLILLQGLIFFPVNYFLTYTACSYLTSGLVALIASMTLLPSVILSLVSKAIHFSYRLIFFVALAIMGSLLVFYDTLMTSPAHRWGTMFAILGIMATAMGLWILPKIKAKTSLSIFSVTGWSMVIGGLSALTIGYLTVGHFEFSTHPTYLRSLAILCLVTPIFFSGHYYFSIHYSPVTASLVFIYAPVISMIMSVLFESYVLTWTDVLGTFCVIYAGTQLAITLARKESAA